MTVSEVDTMEPEVDQMAEPNDYVKDLINSAMAQDYNNANKIFGDVMTVKMDDLLDQEKVRLADQIFNGVEPDDEDDEDIEAEDEQLEFDLETDGESESEEDDDEEELDTEDESED